MYLEDCPVMEVAPVTKPDTKRPAQELPEAELTPRKKFRRVNASLWRETCESAEDLYDVDLPTLEEATLLFGFSRGQSF